MFLSQRINIVLTFHTYFQISPQKSHNNFYSHHQWIQILISPYSGYHWHAEDVCNSSCTSRTSKRTIPPTTVEWLTVPVCRELRRVVGHETFCFKTWKVPGQLGWVVLPTQPLTARIFMRAPKVPVQSFAIADWTRSGCLGEETRITWHEEMIWAPKIVSFGNLLWEHEKDFSLDKRGQWAKHWSKEHGRED